MNLNNKDSNLFCITCSMIIFAIVLFALIITYIVFGIIALVRVSYDEQKDQCYGSNLWVYCLVSLILMGKINMTINNIKEKNNFIIQVIEILISIGMIIWGAYEFFGVDCVKNLNRTLYSVTFAYWLAQIIILGSLTVVCISIVVRLKILGNKQNNNINKSINNINKSINNDNV
jgi:hypothetical protein